MRKRTIALVVIACLGLGFAAYRVFIRSPVPLNLRYPQTSRPMDCFGDSEGSGLPGQRGQGGQTGQGDQTGQAGQGGQAGQEGQGDQTGQADQTGQEDVRAATAAADIEIPFDLTGTWAQRETSSTLSRVPLIGEIDTTTSAFLLVEIRQTGQDIEMIAKDCQIESVPSNDSSRVIIPEAYIAAMAPGHRHAIVEPTSTGFRFRQERFTRVMGARLPDLAAEDLPAEADDPRVSDDDGDGQPGVTVRTEGVIDGDIYLVQRNWNELCGDVTSPDRIEGYLYWGSDQEVLGASSFILNRSLDSIPNPDWERNRFVSCRVAAGATCADILSDRDALFERCLADPE